MPRAQRRALAEPQPEPSPQPLEPQPAPEPAPSAEAAPRPRPARKAPPPRTVDGIGVVPEGAETCAIVRVGEDGRHQERCRVTDEARGIDVDEFPASGLSLEALRAFGPGGYVVQWFGRDPAGKRTPKGYSKRIRIKEPAAPPSPSSGALTAADVVRMIQEAEAKGAERARAEYASAQTLRDQAFQGILQMQQAGFQQMLALVTATAQQQQPAASGADVDLRIQNALLQSELRHQKQITRLAGAFGGADDDDDDDDDDAADGGASMNLTGIPALDAVIERFGPSILEKMMEKQANAAAAAAGAPPARGPAPVVPIGGPAPSGARVRAVSAAPPPPAPAPADELEADEDDEGDEDDEPEE